MNYNKLKDSLAGCYVTVPTLFNDSDLSLNLDGMRKHVNFLIAGGIKTGTGVLLAGGAAGDFSSMEIEERIKVCETVVRETNGRVPVVFGAQTTNTQELIKLAKAGQKAGAQFIQVSPPFYFDHTEIDFLEYIKSVAEVTNIGIIIYNTYWTSLNVSNKLIDDLSKIPQVIGLKWSSPDSGTLDFEKTIQNYSKRFSIIDNQLRFVTSHMLGATSIEVHTCNYWPEWGVSILKLLKDKNYLKVQNEMMRVVAPFMELWMEMEKYTSGDGYLDKLCMELVGMDSSRNRPPTRDLRNQFRDKAQKMMQQTGVPNIGRK